MIVWGAIGGTGTTNKRSELIIMERDEESKKNSYTAQSYLQTLYWGLLPVHKNNLFMQDNAPIHTAYAMTAWFNCEGIRYLISWPLYSPDLNLIEHLWLRLKELVYKLDPELNSITNKDAQRLRLCKVLPKAWEQILAETVQGYLDSIKSRLQAVIDASGWHTKY